MRYSGQCRQSRRSAQRDGLDVFGSEEVFDRKGVVHPIGRIRRPKEIPPHGCVALFGQIVVLHRTVVGHSMGN